MGGDLTANLYWLLALISIHTTRVGGDDKLKTTKNQLAISIHTTRVGGDHLPPAFLFSFVISIHTTRVGGDLS